ncbi:hypothetical protein D3C78_1846480 [compost metagenome]
MIVARTMLGGAPVRSRYSPSQGAVKAAAPQAGALAARAIAYSMAAIRPTWAPLAASRCASPSRRKACAVASLTGAAPPPSTKEPKSAA